MIEKLTGANFQKHDRITIEFDPQITTIVGKSGAGKSAVVRLLRWVCHNKPSGLRCIKWGETEVGGTLTVDGHTITRKRGEHNEYFLDGKRYVSFGNNVPDDIAKIINLDHNNWQFQADSPFWFGLSPNEVSKELNRIVALDKIDEVLMAVAADVRQVKATQTVVEKRLDAARERKKILEWTVTARKDMERIDRIERWVEKKRLRAARLRGLLTEASQAEYEYQTASNAAVDAGNLIAAAKKFTEKRGEWNGIGKTLEQLELLHEEKRGIPPAKTVDLLMCSVNRLNKLEEKRTALKKILHENVIHEEQLCEAKKQIDVATRKIAELTKGKCPTCLRPVRTSSPNA